MWYTNERYAEFVVIPRGLTNIIYSIPLVKPTWESYKDHELADGYSNAENVFVCVTTANFILGKTFFEFSQLLIESHLLFVTLIAFCDKML